MDYLTLLIEYKLDVIDESKHQAGEFKMDIGVVFFSEFGARQGQNGVLQCRFRLGLGSLIPQRSDRMLFVR